MAAAAKSLPKQEYWSEMATHSNILAWEIPWAEKPGKLQSMGSQESDMPQRLNHQEKRGGRWARNIYSYPYWKHKDNVEMAFFY